ncbi:hypothetical protein F4818DRAFT_236193 [Hypoxylon cercidicola]|nr:hypothetical protein F4818DRAFT_236193 [Hypoxylon cercidicola]
MLLDQHTPPLSGLDEPSTSLTKERPSLAKRPRTTIDETTEPIKPPDPTEETNSVQEPSSEDARINEHLARSKKKRRLAQFQNETNLDNDKPPLIKYTDMLGEWNWAKILKFLEYCLADWPKGDEDRRYYLSCIGNKLASIALLDGRSYNLDQLVVYEKFTDCPMRVTDQDLQRVMSISPWYQFRSRSPYFVENGYVLYVTSWSISVAELDTLALYLQEEEKAFEELERWKFVAREGDLAPGDRLTIRYIGSCETADWPHRPLGMKYDEFSKPFAGVLAEFLPAVEKLFPAIAASAETWCIHHKIKQGEREDKKLRKYTFAALLSLYGYPTLINRCEDCDTIYNPSTPLRGSSFAELETYFHYRATELGIICTDELLFELQVLFGDMGEYVAEDPKSTRSELNIMTKFETFRAQSTPFLFQGRKTVLVLAGKSMDMNDYIHGRPFFASENAGALLMKEIIHGLAVAEWMTASHFELFPYYCLLPGIFHEDIQVAESFMWRYFDLVRPMI